MHDAGVDLVPGSVMPRSWAVEGPGLERGPGAAARYAEVAVTLPVPGRFHYVIPEHLAGRALIGARVLVRFGPRKVTGVVVRTDTAPPPGVAPVMLSELLDDEPALSPELVELCAWIAEYYEAPPGEVIRAALPAGSGVAARAVVVLTDAGRAVLDGRGAAMLPRQRALIERLGRLGAGGLPAAGLAAGVRQELARLRVAGLVEEREQREAARARLRRERVVQLAGDAEAARAAVARAPRRIAVAALEQQLPRAGACVRELAKLGLVTVFEREVPIGAAPVGDGMHVTAPPILTDEQRHAVAAITGALRGPDPAGSAPDEIEAGAAPEAGDPGRRTWRPFLLHG